MNIIVNGENILIDESTTVTALIAIRQPQPPFAVAVNDQFVARESYEALYLQEADRVEIVSPMSGG